tara:strand:- start:215 stop:688 length:474 start_codon:yes stop_codon:yes gene_type:complete
MEVKNDMDKLLGYTEWVWDESEVENYNDWDYQEYADWKIGELLPTLSTELMDIENNWEYGIAVGYVGWMNSFGQTEVKEVDSVFLKYMVFDTLNDSNLTAKLDFTKVESGVITLTRSHHDRPMGETIYLFRCEEDQEMLDEEQVLAKLKELGLDEEE